MGEKRKGSGEIVIFFGGGTENAGGKNESSPPIPL